MRKNLIFEETFNCLERRGKTALKRSIMATYNTQQKQELINFLTRNSQKAFSIDEICEAMAADVSCISPPGRSTVYRLIPKLLEENIIRQFSRGSGRKIVYQIVGGDECSHHLHLKCSRCGRIFHMSQKASEELSKKICQSNDFTVDALETVIFGVCKECI